MVFSDGIARKLAFAHQVEDEVWQVCCPATESLLAVIELLP